MTTHGLDAFIASYIETALWSSNDNSDPETGGDPLDANYSADDLSDECRAAMERDCATFYAAHSATWRGAYAHPVGYYTDDEYAAHDFWLTRNGHGAGFWDGDWSEPAAKVLTDASKAFGEVHLYVGDDGKIYMG
jgi:hypothetical protein